jgi:diguanylate cyclase (GGDEF)-like protein/PAS domain S-box-containing protein
VGIASVLVWGGVLGTQLVAVWELADVLLQGRRPAASASVLSLVPAGVLALNAGILHETVPLSAYLFVWMMMWFLAESRGWRLAGALWTTALWILTAWGGAHSADHVATGAGVLLAGMVGGSVLPQPSRTRSAAIWTGTAMVVAVLLGLAVWGVNPNAVQDLLTSLSMGAVVASYVVYQTWRRRRWAQAEWRGDHDALTGLLTRHGLARWHEAHKASVMLVVACDLDDFKRVNDTFGHDAGDAILKEFTSRLRVSVRVTDALVRPGGDEVTLWIPDVPESDAPRLVRALHAAATQGSYTFQGGSLWLGVSMGWAIGPANESTATAADRELLRAKRHGKNRVMPPQSDEEPTNGAAGAGQGMQWLYNAAIPLWEAWPEAAVLRDERGRILTANPAFERLSGWPAAALREDPPGELTPGGESPASSAVSLAFQHGGAWEGYSQHRRPGGQAWWGRETLVPIRVADQLIGYWGHVREESPRDPADPEWALVFPDGLEKLEMDVVFQPIVHVRDEQAIGWEALVRPRIEGRPVSPSGLFSAVAGRAEEVPCDLLALQSIAAAVAALGWPRGESLRLFVNVSFATLRAEAEFDAARRALAALVTGTRLVFEVGEHASRSCEEWRWLRERYPDLQWAQDDVGVGRADLSRLLEFQPHWIKIDHTIVHRLSDPRARRLVAALVDWARGADAMVIAEGVEDPVQLQHLKELGVDCAQGYFWARPSAELVLPAALTPAGAGY